MDPAENVATGAVPWSRSAAPSRAEVVFLRGERRDAKRLARRLFGRRIERFEYAGLTGAPDDAVVEVGTLAGDLYLEMRHRVADRYCEHLFVRPTGAGPVLVNDGLRIHREAMRRQGLGLTIFFRQLCLAKTLGVRRIEVTAGRSRTENGYYTWPRFGMEGFLPPAVQGELPPGLRCARTVLDLMESEPGRWWWKTHGTTVDLAFDLADGSRCWKVLEAYLRVRL